MAVQLTLVTILEDKVSMLVGAPARSCIFVAFSDGVHSA
jgi:hypothetical protein